jgi:hypothetical protein
MIEKIVLKSKDGSLITITIEGSKNVEYIKSRIESIFNVGPRNPDYTDEDINKVNDLFGGLFGDIFKGKK